MVNRVKDLKATIAASTSTYTEIDSITVPEKRVYRVLELAVLTATSCKIQAQVENDILATFDHDFINLDKRRRLVDWELRAGEKLSVLAINNDGSGHALGIEVTYDDKEA